jgi:hypothetical protein
MPMSCSPFEISLFHVPSTHAGKQYIVFVRRVNQVVVTITTEKVICINSILSSDVISEPLQCVTADNLGLSTTFLL